MGYRYSGSADPRTGNLPRMAEGARWETPFHSAESEEGHDLENVEELDETLVRKNDGDMDVPDTGRNVEDRGGRANDDMRKMQELLLQSIEKLTQSVDQMRMQSASREDWQPNVGINRECDRVDYTPVHRGSYFPESRNVLSIERERYGSRNVPRNNRHGNGTSPYRGMDGFHRNVVGIGDTSGDVGRNFDQYRMEDGPNVGSHPGGPLNYPDMRYRSTPGAGFPSRHDRSMLSLIHI